MSESATTVEAPSQGLPPGDHEPGFFQRYGVALIFLAPTLVLLGVWVVYPTIRTIIRSFYDRDGDEFIGLDNYETLFTDDTLVTAIKNNFLWLLIVPAFVTAIGLVFAVLLERIRFSVAFKVVVFMPMAISLFAAGVIWRLMYEKDPSQGTINAGIAVVKDAVSPSGVLSAALPSTEALQGGPEGGLVLEKPLAPGDVAQLGLTGIRASDVPADAEQAVVPEALAGGITGVVWRDFKPGGGVPGQVEEEELGLPGITVELRDEGGRTVTETQTEADGTFAFEDVEAGPYRAAIGPDPVSEPYAGVSWLGASLITPAIMMAYVWVWAGFAMVVIAAGLAAIPRDLLEAARTDGATEWDIFRRIQLPLLSLPIAVVSVWMIINVIKIFDIVYIMTKGGPGGATRVIAYSYYVETFENGLGGYGAAVAIVMLLLIIPVMIWQIRRFRSEAVIS